MMRASAIYGCFRSIGHADDSRRVDKVSAFAAVATCMNNLGLGLGQVAYSFQSVSDFGKMIGVCAMLIGRLEEFTILVLLSSDFWRR